MVCTVKTRLNQKRVDHLELQQCQHAAQNVAGREEEKQDGVHHGCGLKVVVEAEGGRTLAVETDQRQNH